MVNPATQDNKVISFLIVDAFKASEQDLDANEEVNVKLFDFNSLDSLIQEKKITQLFTVSAYLMAKNYLGSLS